MVKGRMGLLASSSKAVRKHSVAAAAFPWACNTSPRLFHTSWAVLSTKRDMSSSGENDMSMCRAMYSGNLKIWTKWSYNVELNWNWTGNKNWLGCVFYQAWNLNNIQAYLKKTTTTATTRIIPPNYMIRKAGWWSWATLQLMTNAWPPENTIMWTQLEIRSHLPPSCGISEYSQKPLFDGASINSCQILVAGLGLGHYPGAQQCFPGHRHADTYLLTCTASLRTFSDRL